MACRGLIKTQFRWIGWVGLMLWPLLARADPELGIRDLMHARDYGMGGAYQGTGLGAEQIMGNPAGLAVYKKYQIELNGALDFKNPFKFADLALSDSTNEVAAGVNYTYAVLGTGPTLRHANLTTVAVGVPFGSVFSIGASGHYMKESGAVRSNAITMDVAAMLRIFDVLGISAQAKNLIDIRNPDMTRYYVASAAFMGQLFTADVDIQADFTAHPTALRYAGGLEYLLGSSIPLRAGYSFDAAQKLSYLGLGAGWMTDGGGIDVGYRQTLNGVGRVLSVTIKIQM